MPERIGHGHGQTLTKDERKLAKKLSLLPSVREEKMRTEDIGGVSVYLDDTFQSSGYLPVLWGEVLAVATTRVIELHYPHTVTVHHLILEVGQGELHKQERPGQEEADHNSKGGESLFNMVSKGHTGSPNRQQL